MTGLMVDDKMIEYPFKWRWCLDPVHTHIVRFIRRNKQQKSDPG